MLIIILGFQTARERVHRRTLNTMSGMVRTVLEQRIKTALDAMTDEAIQALDQSTSRLGLDRDDRNRVVELPE